MDTVKTIGKFWACSTSFGPAEPTPLQPSIPCRPGAIRPVMGVLHLEDSDNDAVVLQKRFAIVVSPLRVTRVRNSGISRSTGSRRLGHDSGGLYAAFFDGISALKLRRRETPRRTIHLRNRLLGEEQAVAALKGVARLITAETSAWMSPAAARHRRAMQENIKSAEAQKRPMENSKPLFENGCFCRKSITASKTIWMSQLAQPLSNAVDDLSWFLLSEKVKKRIRFMSMIHEKVLCTATA